MKRYGLAIVLIGLMAGLMAGCTIVPIGMSGLRGSGDLVTESYGFEDFTRIEASNAFQVTITQGNEFRVEVTTDDNTLDELRVEQVGDTVRLGLRQFMSLMNVTLRAEITMPTLEGIEASGASTMVIAGFVGSDGGADLDARASGASRITAKIETGDLTLELSGASNATISGSGGDLTVRASGASRANLADFPVADARVELSGASNAVVNVSGELVAEASGASRVEYVGNPQQVREDTSGASEVEPRN